MFFLSQFCRVVVWHIRQHQCYESFIGIFTVWKQVLTLAKYQKTCGDTFIPSMMVVRRSSSDPTGLCYQSTQHLVPVLKKIWIPAIQGVGMNKWEGGKVMLIKGGYELLLLVWQWKHQNCIKTLFHFENACGKTGYFRFGRVDMCCFNLQGIGHKHAKVRVTFPLMCCTLVPKGLQSRWSQFIHKIL